MTGQSAAIAGLTSCAASATVASKSFFMVSSYAETNGGCEQKLLIVPLLRDHGNITTILDPLLLRPGHRYRESDVPWPAIAGQHLDGRACARCGPLLLIPNLTHLFASACAGNKALCHLRAGDRLEAVAASWCGSQTLVGLGRARLVSGFSVRNANTRPLSGPSSHVSCNNEIIVFRVNAVKAADREQDIHG